MEVTPGDVIRRTMPIISAAFALGFAATVGITRAVDVLIHRHRQ